MQISWKRGQDLEAGKIMTFGNLYEDRVVSAFSVVVLLESLPEPVDLNAYDGICFWIEIGSAGERLYADRLFLDLFGMLFQNLGRQKTKQRLKGWRISKSAGSGNSLHLVMT